MVWQGESGTAPFTRMTVFDSPAVALHLDGSMTYVFTPADLALFRYAHAAIEGMRGLLDEARAAREPHTDGNGSHLEFVSLGLHPNRS